MAPDEKSEIAPEEPAQTSVGPKFAPKPRQALARMPRELTEKEFAQSGTQKLLADELYRLDAENASLAWYREEYHDKSVRLAVLMEKRKRGIGWGVMSSGTLVIGAALLGFAPSMWGKQPEAAGEILLVTGSVLTICGIIAQVVQQWI